MKNECDLVKDLLFSYNDNILSNTSKELVEEHLKKCDECKKILEEIKQDSNDKKQIKEIIWYKRLKKEKCKKEIPLDVLQNTLFIQESIEDNFCNKETKIKLFKKLQSFDETTRNVMYLRIFGNFEYSEIAEIMDKTSNWARVVFFRGKQKLKEELENEK